LDPHLSRRDVPRGFLYYFPPFAEKVPGRFLGCFGSGLAIGLHCK
jgi:hypothetical protein